MIYPIASRHARRALAVMSFFAAGWAHAASVDLVVNVSADKANYTAAELETYTVVLTNRGPANATNATFSLDVPSTRSSALPWNSSVTCVASGGAVCPASYTLPLGTTTLRGTVPSLPLNGKLTLTVPAPGSVASFVSGAMNVVAKVAPGATDTNADSRTDTSNIFVYIAPPRLGFGTAVAGPATLAAPGNTQATYTVVLQNTSADTNDIVSRMALAAAQGTGSASALDYLPGTRFNSISCTAATGGASCANVVATVNAPFQPTIISPQPVPLVNLTNSNSSVGQSIGATQMPGGSSLTLTVVVDVGVAACSTGGPADNRALTLTSTVRNISPSGRGEVPATAGDNTAVQTTAVAALQCLTGDLVVNTITQPAGQTSAGVGPNAPFSYTVTYSNAAGGTATNVPLQFGFGWPVAGGSLNTPSCVAAGGAVCPAAYSLSGSISSAASPSLPAGGSLQVTYTGTSGADTTQQCQPLYATVQAAITPPSDFLDTNYDLANPVFQTNTNRMGNNSYQVISQANIGVPCGPSFDAVATKSGPYSDFAATILAPLPLKPGQYVYFKTSASNAAPGLPFTDYAIGDFVQNLYLGDTGAYNDIGSASNRIEMAAKPGDPPGLSVPPNYTSPLPPTVAISQFDMGVHCTASGGAVCPDFAVPGSSGGGGVGYWHSGGWNAYWSGPTKPVFPVGGRLDFVSTYRVPPLNPLYSASGCFGTGELVTGSNLAFFGAVIVDPLGSDRTTSNDDVQVPLSVNLPACDQTLAVTKTISAPGVPASGLLDYTIVVTNTSANTLDLPKLIDYTNDTLAPVMTITCQSTTLGAVCPSFTPQQGVKVLADGSSRPINGLDTTQNVLPAFDFVWGSPGAATMPPNSTVTFHVTAQYPVGQIPLSNIVLFTGAEESLTGRWPTVGATAGPTVPSAGAFGVAKSVAPQQALPGQTVSYSVDALNYVTDATNVAFNDAVSAAMAAANPAGFSNLACRPLTTADNVFPPTTTVVAATCPVFTSAASGITATIPLFPANSGFRLTYNAIAPATSSSVPNIVQLQHTANIVTIGDANSQVNYGVFAVVLLSGNVFNDVNGSQVKDGGETSTTLPAGLQAVITDSNGVLVATVPIDANGNYSAPVPGNASYTVTVTPPAGWLTTGENLAGVPDGAANGQQTVAVGTVDRPDVNFGIEQPPVAGNALYPSQPNPGGTATVPVGAGAFTGVLPSGVTGTNASDPAPGAVTSVTIPRFPSNTTTITINGVTYTAATFPPAGVTVTVAQLAGMVLDPVDGAVSVVIPYTVADAAGKVSAEGSVTLPLVIGPDVSTTTSVVNNNNGTSTFTVVTRNAPAVGTANNTVTTLQLPTGLAGVTASNGGIYDPATGLVTWPPITLVPGASNPTPQTVTMPYTTGTTVRGDATVTTTGEASTVLANNPSNAGLGSGLPAGIPTLGEWGLWLLTGLMLLAGGLRARRRRPPAPASRRVLPVGEIGSTTQDAQGS